MNEFVLICLQRYVRYFPFDKGKNWLIRALCGRLTFNDFQRITRLRRVPVQMLCDLSKHIQRDIFFWGTYHYEEQLLNFWMGYARGAKVIFDVGANVGIYSLSAASANPAAFVHAFEPTSEMSDKLVAHVSLNNLSNVTINRQAVGRADEDGYVHICKGSDGANEGMNFVTTGESPLCRPVAIRSLDSYCREHAISRIDLMKIDIEGGEYDALLGMQGLLSRKGIGCIFLELVEWASNRYGHSTADIKRVLHANGYRLYEINSGGLKPLDPEGVHRGESNILAFADTPAK